MGEARRIHHYDQLHAALRDLVRSVLAPHYRTCIEEGLPPEAATELVCSLQYQFIEELGRPDDDDDSG